ncbi:hypothetical protein GCM10010399_86810 [Dactylosporangium fulvum]
MRGSPYRLAATVADAHTTPAGTGPCSTTRASPLHARLAHTHLTHTQLCSMTPAHTGSCHRLAPPGSLRLARSAWLVPLGSHPWTRATGSPLQHHSCTHGLMHTARATGSPL